MDSGFRQQFYVIVLLFAGCQGEPWLVLINGALWTMEDLVVEGRDRFSYQQALSACPEGWSLATSEDWTALLERFGGYDNAGVTIGDPKKSF